MAVSVACVIGTRPEAVKMAPVIARLRRPGSGFAVRVVSTGQHRELLDGALADFGLAADDDLGLMRPGQDLADLTARGLLALTDWIDRRRPEVVIGQGDTTTVLCAALACHYRRVPFVHVEAGLRSGDLGAPFPEEANRSLVARLTDLHFAPTEAARANLLREGITDERIAVVGNPVIDALHWIAERSGPPPVAPPARRFLLMTSHRRESHGLPLARACRAVRTLVERDDDLGAIVPVHPNPRVREVVERELGDVDRVRLIGPVGYPGFVALMKAADLILTDSGGIQEEAPALGKPVLVLRETTERPEAVAVGACRLVGTDPDQIVAEAAAILADPRPWPAVSPYGDGRAAERIAAAMATRYRGLRPESEAA